MYYKKILDVRFIANSMTPFTMWRLEKFLENFKDVYEFVFETYFYGYKNRELVDRLIRQGKYRIKTVQDVIDYCELACDFWNYRSEILIKGKNNGQ
jgi:hypothetical protein